MKTVIAVDLGATNVRVARISEDGSIEELRKDTVAGLTGARITAGITSLITEVMDETVGAIGISTAGPIDATSGCVIKSPNMRASRISLVQPISDKFRLPVRMLTDCKAGVLGEHLFGSGKDLDNLVYVTISSGIGCGVLQNGVLIEGADGNAGEVGHFVVDTFYEMPCGCGGKGHWESYCSGTGIPKFYEAWCRAHSSSSGGETAEEILMHAEAGHGNYRQFGLFLKQLNARAVQSVICAYNPAMIVLDGPVALKHHWLFTGLELGYLRRPKIVFSRLNGNAPLLGAAALLHMYIQQFNSKF